MNILHIAPIIIDRPNGPTYSVSALANTIALSGHHVALLSCCPFKGPFKLLSSNVVNLPKPCFYHWNPWVISSSWLDIIEQGFGIPDIVNFHGAYYPFQSSLAKRMLFKAWPYIITPRGSFQVLAQRQKPLKKIFGNIMFMNEFIRNASVIHALTDEEAADIHKLFPKQNIFVCPNGVDSELINVSSQTQPLYCNGQTSNTLVLGFLGRITVWHKGIDLLIKAVLLLQKKNPSLDVRLVIIGSFHSKKDKKVVNYLHQKMKYPEKLILLGPIMGGNKFSHLLGCDVFVHTSRFEGMPNSVLEAMAIGKPCLVTPGSNMQSIIKDCDGGWLTDGKVEAIATQIQYISKHRDEVLIKGTNARKYISQNLTWPKIAQQYLTQVSNLSEKILR